LEGLPGNQAGQYVELTARQLLRVGLEGLHTRAAHLLFLVDVRAALGTVDVGDTLEVLKQRRLHALGELAGLDVFARVEPALELVPIERDRQYTWCDVRRSV